MLEPGLHVIFDSIRDSQPSTEAEIEYAVQIRTRCFGGMLISLLASVVAVHGLNFKNNPDHGRETWVAGDKLWLKDFLPAYLPKPARVMLFVYNSSPAMGAASLRLDDHGRNLLQRLNLKRKVSATAAI